MTIGTNPGGGVLSGTTTKNASSGIASFSDLMINQAGSGYTLTASASGLTGANSSAFTVLTGSGGGGGTIAGVVTRVSNGTAISGVAVEAFQGTVLKGISSTSSNGSYSIPGLANGVYTVRASFTGFVPQIREGITIVNAGTVTVNLSLNSGIAIHSPVAGAVLNDFSVRVTGQFDTSLGAEFGINVNGYVALQDQNEFATLIPVDSTTTSVTATLTNTSGTALASHTIPVTVQPPASQPVLLFRPSPAIALVSQPVTFTLTSLNPIAQIQLDANGDGTIDFTGTTLQGQSVTFGEPGLHFPTVRVTDTGGNVQTATSIIQVLDMNQMDSLLQSKWNGNENCSAWWEYQRGCELYRREQTGALSKRIQQSHSPFCFNRPISYQHHACRTDRPIY
jgi:hypothetical protein